MTHRILLVLTALLLSLFLFACSTVGDSPEAPNISDVPDEQPNNPAASEDENIPAEKNMAETNEFAYETEPLPENLEVRHCVDNVLSFTSLTDMNQQIRAIQTISPSDSSYEQYQAANATSVASYLVPDFTFYKNLPSYELTKILMYPYLTTYFYEYESPEGNVEKFRVEIVRVPEEDPLRDMEISYGKRRDADGYLHTPRMNDVAFVTDSGHLVGIVYPDSWIDVYQLSYREIADMLTIRTVTVNPDHVTE